MMGVVMMMVMMLLMMMVTYLVSPWGRYGEAGITVVYAGAAPGMHMHYLAELFPEVKVGMMMMIMMMRMRMRMRMMMMMICRRR
jgi:hypothetical protein